MRRRSLPGSLVSLLPLVVALAAVVGCKRSVDLAQFDAGASTAAAVSAPAAASAVPVASAAAPDEPLAPLTSSKPAVAATAPKAAAGKTATKPAAPAAPKGPIPECENAKVFCNNRFDPKMRAECDKALGECKAKGGSL